MASPMRKCTKCSVAKERAADYNKEEWICDACMGVESPSKEARFVKYTSGTKHSGPTLETSEKTTMKKWTGGDGSSPMKVMESKLVEYAGPVVAVYPGNYKDARRNRPEEPWTGKLKNAATQPQIAMVQVSPVLVKEDFPTLQTMPEKQVLRYEASPVGKYDNLIGVRKLTVQPETPPVIQKRVVEMPLLPQVKGETIRIKADVNPIQPVGTRAAPAKALPNRDHFQVSGPTVVKTDVVFAVMDAHTVRTH